MNNKTIYTILIYLFALIFTINIRAQNDTINLRSYSQHRDSTANRVLYKYSDGSLIHCKTINWGNCYTQLRNSIITEKKCYDSSGKLIKWMYGNGETYILEEYGENIRKTYLNWQLDPLSFEEYDTIEDLISEVTYKNGKKYLESFYSDDKRLFSIKYNEEIPAFEGDTIFSDEKLTNGLYFRNDTLYAVYDSKILFYKYFIKKKVNKFWSAEKRLVYDENGRLKQSKIYKTGKAIFDYSTHKYFEFYEYDGNGDVKLKVCCLDNNIAGIEIFTSNKKIELNYFLEQLQVGKEKEYFEGGYYLTTVGLRATPTKYRVELKEGEISDRKEIPLPFKIFSGDEKQFEIYYTTGNLITIDEFNNIKAKAFGL